MDMSNIIDGVFINGAEVSANVMELSMKNGRSKASSEMEAGTATIVLDNGTGTFNGSAYPKTGQEVFIRSAGIRLYTGFVESVKTNNVDGVAQITVSVSDQLARLGRVTIEDNSLDARQPLYDFGLADTGTTYLNRGSESLSNGTLKRVGTSGTYQQSVAVVGTVSGLRLNPTNVTGLNPNYDSGWYVEALTGNTAAPRPIVEDKDWSFGGWLQPQNATDRIAGFFAYGASAPAIRCWADTDRKVITFSNFAYFVDGGLATYNHEINSAAVFDGGWHHLVFTYEASTSTLRVYVDGAMVTSVVMPTSGWKSIPPQRSIIFGGSRLFDGAYMEVFKGGMASWFADNKLWNDNAVLTRYKGEAASTGEKASERSFRLGATQYLGTDYLLSAMEFDANSTILSELKRLARSVNGVVYADRGGQVTVRTNEYNNAKYRGTLPFEIESDATLEVNDDDLVNSVTITKADGALLTATDDASIAAYGTHKQQIDVALQADSDALASAQWNVYEFSQPTVTAEMSIDFTSLPNGSLTPASFLLHDVYTVPVLNGADYRIEGIELHITRDSAQGHFILYEASKFNGYVQLDSTTFGQLGVNRLAF